MRNRHDCSISVLNQLKCRPWFVVAVDGAAAAIAVAVVVVAAVVAATVVHAV